MSRWWVAASLLARFLVEVVRSGWATAWLILAGGPIRKPGLVRMSYDEGLSDTGAVVLGLLITLTPGATTVDLDPARREFLLHLLDARDSEGAVAAIRRDFERPLRALFEERR